MMNSLRFTIYIKRLQPCPAVTKTWKRNIQCSFRSHTHSVHLYKNKTKQNLTTSHKPKAFREGLKSKKINKDESHAQQQAFPEWPGEVSASNQSDQALPSSITWGSVTRTSESPPLASSHTERFQIQKHLCLLTWSAAGRSGWEGVKYGGRKNRDASHVLSGVHRRPALQGVITWFLHRPSFSLALGLTRNSFQVCQRWWKPWGRWKHPPQEWGAGPFSVGWKGTCT